MLGSSDVGPTPLGDDPLATTFAELRRSLSFVARRAHADSGGADGVGATLLVAGRSVFAGSNPFTEAVDDVQYGLQQGPCLTAVARQEVTASRTIGAGEERWAVFTTPAAALGLRSVASTPVWSASTVVGSLNFYGRDAATFDTTTDASLHAQTEPAGRAMVTAWLLAVAAANAQVLARAVQDREDPRDPESFGDPGHRQVLTHDGLQRPPQAAARQLRPRLRRSAGVLAPHVPAPAALVAAQCDQQSRGSPAQRLVGQPADHRVPRCSFAAAAPAPPVGLDHAAGQHGPVWLQPLPDNSEAQSRQGGRTWSGQGDRR